MTQLISSMFHNCLVSAVVLVASVGFIIHTFQIFSMVQTAYSLMNKIKPGLRHYSFVSSTQGKISLAIQLLALCSPSILPKTPYTKKIPPITMIARRTIRLYFLVFLKENIHAIVQLITVVGFLQPSLYLILRGLQGLTRILICVDNPITELIVTIFLCLLVSLYTYCFAYAVIITGELNSDSGDPRRQYNRRHRITGVTFTSVNQYSVLIYLGLAVGFRYLGTAGFYRSLGLALVLYTLGIELAYWTYNRWSQKRHRHSTSRYYVPSDNVINAFLAIVWYTLTDIRYLYAGGYKNLSYKIPTRDAFKRE